MTEIARLTLAARTIETADANARQGLEGAQKSMGFVPNMYANMANSPGLLDNYLKGYDLFRKQSGFAPAEQETVFLTISRFHGCTYCMAAHSMIGDKVTQVPAAVLEALRAGTVIPDAKLQSLSEFTLTMLETRGRPSPAALSKFLAAGFTEKQALEVILAIAVKTLSNYSNHLFDTKTDAAFANYAWT